MPVEWLFNWTGSIALISPPTGRNYEPATLSIPDLENSSGATVILTNADIVKEVIHSAEVSLQNELYFYAFANRFMPFQVIGYCFNPDAQCAGAETEIGANQVLDWFDSNSAYSTTLRTISITYGDKTITALLTGVMIKKPYPEVPLYQLVLRCYPTSVA